MDLTPAEEKIILERRAQQKEEKRRKERTLLILEHAFLYMGWLTENERASSYSTFVNEYGYDEAAPVDAIHDAIVAIHRLAADFADKDIRNEL